MTDDSGSEKVPVDRPTVAEDSATDHEIVHLITLNGGTRQYLDGMHYFVTVGNGWDEERVTLWTKDGPGLAEALRRAADQIDGKARSPFALPPVTVPMGAVCMNCGEHYEGLPAPVGFCSSDCASAAHAAIVDPHDWRI